MQDCTHTHNYAHIHTYLCTQRANTNHKCKALAVTDVGRELGGKRNTFISFCASFGFHGADATREKMGRESAGLPISRHTGLQSQYMVAALPSVALSSNINGGIGAKLD